MGDIVLAPMQRALRQMTQLGAFLLVPIMTIRMFANRLPDSWDSSVSVFSQVLVAFALLVLVSIIAIVTIIGVHLAWIAVLMFRRWRLQKASARP